METTTTPRSQMSVAFRYAIICALITIIYFIILWLLKLESNKAAGWVSYLILIAVMFIGIKDYRDKDNGGFIQYGKALSTGVLIAIFTGIIYAVFIFIFVSFIDPQFIQNILDTARQSMVEKGTASDEQIEMAMKYTKMFTTPPMIALFSILGYAFMGLIISLIESAILKKDNPQMPQA